MRNLAEVCTIKSAETITYNNQVYTKVQKYSLNENAYEFVAQAGFTVGEKVIFIGEGAMIPASNANFEFLRSKCFSPKWNMFRIKPQKMCGLISMGILMPMNIVDKDYKIGSDLTDTLAIQKYEDMEDASPKKHENKIKSFLFHYFRPLAKLIWKSTVSEEFPTWLISKTDETNIENCTEDLEKYADSPYYVTGKMEGQSGSFVLDKKNKFYCCSRNCAYTKPVDNTFWTVAKKYGIEKILKDYYKKNKEHLIIQGEICGPAIQRNIYKFNTLHLFVFNIKSIERNEYLSFEEIATFCLKNNLKMVPTVKFGIKLFDFVNKNNINTVRENIVEKFSFMPTNDDSVPSTEISDSKIDNKKRFHMEGIVIRTKDQKFSCKFKSPQYALWFSGKDDE